MAHFIAVYTGVYDAQLRGGVVWFDNILHTLVGFAFGLIWLAALRRWRPESSFLYTSTTLIAFVVAMAVAWELFELAFYLIFKSGALGLKVYSPSVREATFDSISNLCGALLLLAALPLALKKKTTEAERSV